MNLHGLPDDVKRSRLYLLEGITAAVQDTFEISESISKVFSKDEVKPYLMEQLLSKGISASWMCNGRSVVVFASDNENLEDAIRVLKNEVVEAHLNLELRISVSPLRGRVSSDVYVRKTDYWKSA